MKSPSCYREMGKKRRTKKKKKEKTQQNCPGAPKKTLWRKVT